MNLTYRSVSLVGTREAQKERSDEKFASEPWHRSCFTFHPIVFSCICPSHPIASFCISNLQLGLLSVSQCRASGVEWSGEMHVKILEDWNRFPATIHPFSPICLTSDFLGPLAQNRGFESNKVNQKVMRIMNLRHGQATYLPSQQMDQTSGKPSGFSGLSEPYQPEVSRRIVVAAFIPARVQDTRSPVLITWPPQNRRVACLNSRCVWSRAAWTKKKAVAAGIAGTVAASKTIVLKDLHQDE